MVVQTFNRSTGEVEAVDPYELEDSLSSIQDNQGYTVRLWTYQSINKQMRSQQKRRREKLCISHNHLDFLVVHTSLSCLSLFHKTEYLGQYLMFSYAKMFP